ncbi:MAG: hypothetical protein ACP5RR_04495 [Candidatus Kapaibacteriota bacterium]
MMKKLFGLLIFILIFFSCSSGRISVNRFPDYIEIQSGDSIWIHWDFVNAKYVKVGGYDVSFNTTDSLLLKPNTSMRLDVTAFGGGNQQLTQSVYILVNPKETKISEQKKTIQRGPKIIENIFNFKNNFPTSYFCGFSDSPITNASRLKVFRIKKHVESDSAIVAFAILDENGNFCHEVTKYSTDIRIQIEQKCKGKPLASNYFPLANSFHTEDNLDVYLLVDYAIINENPDLKKQILNAVKFLDVKDRASLYFFGVELFNAIPLERADKFYWDLEELTFPKRFELSSIYRSLWFLLGNIEAKGNSVIILITNRMDNSSINYTLEDVIDRANNKLVSINSIILGNEASPSAYKYLSAKTGGSSYHFPWINKDFELGLIETILSNKYYYSIPFQLSNNLFSCKDLDLKLSVILDKINFADYFSFPLQERIFYTNYQALSLFAKTDTSISEIFFPSIENLAKLLIAHRNLILELVGTAGISESFFDPMKLSTERALAVQKRLISLGVYPSQVRARGIGSSKPLYPDENDEMSSLFNRRVEIRWLLPDVLPYTIVVDTAMSEDQAENIVDFWVRKGFKAYYDRLFSNNRIMYKIVLWGYRTYDEAERDAKKIFRKYRKNANVE